MPPAPLSASTFAAHYEALYLRAREVEGRRLDVSAIRRLPQPAVRSPHAREWRQRATTSAWLLRHLEGRGARRILDLGCGYGWLAALIADRTGAEVVALDASAEELERAQKAFGSNSRIQFVCGDIFEDGRDALAAPFDAIVLSASIQYFPDLAALFSRLTHVLRPAGETIILDSPIWRAEDVAAARARSNRYYTSLGLGPLAEAFHQHAREDLARFAARWYYLPDSWSARLRRHVLRQPVSSFPIVGIPRLS